MFISRKFADRLAMPVVELTENIKEIKGDNLDFRWDMDTNDEIQTLAESFASLTERMKKYIVDMALIGLKLLLYIFHTQNVNILV